MHIHNEIYSAYQTKYPVMTMGLLWSPSICAIRANFHCAVTLEHYCLFLVYPLGGARIVGFVVKKNKKHILTVIRMDK